MNITPATEAATPQNPPLYNLAQLADLSCGDENFVPKMINIFIRQVHTFMDEISGYRQSGNLQKIASATHKFKPSVANLCQPFLYNDIKQIELLALRGEPFDELLILLPRFLQNISEVVRQLEEKLRTPEIK